MTTTAPEKTMTVAEAAAAIAAEIRSLGHYQGQALLDSVVRPLPVCLVLNYTIPALPVNTAMKFYEEIRDRAKMTAAYPANSDHSLRAKTVMWNDRESTERVLEVLDAIAISGA